MANQLHIYYGNPTAGSTDGTEASSGTEPSPISVTLDASKEEQKAVKCAVRCDSGYYIEGSTAIKFVGDGSEKWRAAVDNNYADEDAALKKASWQETLALDGVTDKNTIFWVKATSSKEEKPQNDTSVDIQAEGLVVAV